MVPMISWRSEHGGIAHAKQHQNRARTREDLGKRAGDEENLGKIRENEYTKNKDKE